MKGLVILALLPLVITAIVSSISHSAHLDTRLQLAVRSIRQFSNSQAYVSPRDLCENLSPSQTRALITVLCHQIESNHDLKLLNTFRLLSELGTYASDQGLIRDLSAELISATLPRTGPIGTRFAYAVLVLLDSCPKETIADAEVAQVVVRLIVRSEIHARNPRLVVSVLSALTTEDRAPVLDHLSNRRMEKDLLIFEGLYDLQYGRFVSEMLLLREDDFGWRYWPRKFAVNRWLRSKNDPMFFSLLLNRILSRGQIPLTKGRHVPVCADLVLNLMQRDPELAAWSILKPPLSGNKAHVLVDHIIDCLRRDHGLRTPPNRSDLISKCEFLLANSPMDTALRHAQICWLQRIVIGFRFPNPVNLTSFASLLCRCLQELQTVVCCPEWLQILSAQLSYYFSRPLDAERCQPEQLHALLGQVICLIDQMPQRSTAGQYCLEGQRSSSDVDPMLMTPLVQSIRWAAAVKDAAFISCLVKLKESATLANLMFSVNIVCADRGPGLSVLRLPEADRYALAWILLQMMSNVNQIPNNAVKMICDLLHLVAPIRSDGDQQVYSLEILLKICDFARSPICLSHPYWSANVPTAIVIMMIQHMSSKALRQLFQSIKLVSQLIELPIDIDDPIVDRMVDHIMTAAPLASLSGFRLFINNIQAMRSSCRSNSIPR